MKVPNLRRIVETVIPIASTQPSDYLDQLRTEVLKHIRELQSSGQIDWYSVLVHNAGQVDGRAQGDKNLVFHIRLEPSSELSIDELITRLPPHFRDPHPAILRNISGLEGELLEGADWAHAWRVVGESAEWVLCLLEAHATGLPTTQTIQFMHYITNLLGLGHQCVHTPSRRQF